MIPIVQLLKFAMLCRKPKFMTANLCNIQLLVQGFGKGPSTLEPYSTILLS